LCVCVCVCVFVCVCVCVCLCVSKLVHSFVKDGSVIFGFVMKYNPLVLLSIIEKILIKKDKTVFYMRSPWKWFNFTFKCPFSFYRHIYRQSIILTLIDKKLFLNDIVILTIKSKPDSKVECIKSNKNKTFHKGVK